MHRHPRAKAKDCWRFFATYYNKLQLPATLCNTLQHTSSHVYQHRHPRATVQQCQQSFANGRCRGCRLPPCNSTRTARCVAVCQRVAVCGSVMQCNAVCWQCDTVCCSVFQTVLPRLSAASLRQHTYYRFVGLVSTCE